MANVSLSAAKSAKNDEFYTQYYDIEREINAYLEFDPDVFRGKTVLLPCDDPEWSYCQGTPCAYNGKSAQVDETHFRISNGSKYRCDDGSLHRHEDWGSVRSEID